MSTEKITADQIEVHDRVKQLVARRSILLRALIAPFILDVLLSFLAIPFIAQFATIFEELIEFFISKYFAGKVEDLELSNTDKIFGFVPIPGVTAFNVRCARELYSIQNELKKLV